MCTNQTRSLPASIYILAKETTDKISRLSSVCFKWTCSAVRIVQRGETWAEREFLSISVSCWAVMLGSGARADPCSNCPPLSLTRGDHSADHDNPQHQCPELSAQSGLRNSHGLVHSRVLRFCVLCADRVCHRQLFHKERLGLGWKKSLGSSQD